MWDMFQIMIINAGLHEVGDDFYHPARVYVLSPLLPYTFFPFVVIVSVIRPPLTSTCTLPSFSSLLCTSIVYSTIVYPRQNERASTLHAYWIETTHFSRAERRRNFLWGWNFALFRWIYTHKAELIMAGVVWRKTGARVAATSPLCRADGIAS